MASLVLIALLHCIAFTLSAKRNEVNAQGQRGDANLLSVVLFTNRPGVWDIALYSLAAQTSSKYEVGTDTSHAYSMYTRACTLTYK